MIGNVVHDSEYTENIEMTRLYRRTSGMARVRSTVTGNVVQVSESTRKYGNTSAKPANVGKGSGNRKLANCTENGRIDRKLSQLVSAVVVFGRNHTRACYRLVNWSEHSGRVAGKLGTFASHSEADRQTSWMAEGRGDAAGSRRSRGARVVHPSASPEGARMCSARSQKAPRCFLIVIFGARVSRPVPVRKGRCAFFRLATRGGMFISS
jgi:hypothetical protein